MKCATQEGEPVALKFAGFGYHVFLLRYSTYFSSEKDFNIPISKEEIQIKNHCIFPNPILEIGKSMLIINELSDEWNIDRERISLCGFSAGAHNVAMYSNFWNSEIFSKYFKIDTRIFKPISIILGYIAADLYFTKIENIPKEKELFFRTSYMAIAGKQELLNEDIIKLSPSIHINKDTPPTFLWSTCEDDFVSVRNTLKMAEALAQNNVPFEVHIFEEGSHGLSLGTQASAKVKEQVDNNVAKWIELVETWLSKRMKIELCSNGRS